MTDDITPPNDFIKGRREYSYNGKGYKINPTSEQRKRISTGFSLKIENVERINSLAEQLNRTRSAILDSIIEEFFAEFVTRSEENRCGK